MLEHHIRTLKAKIEKTPEGEKKEALASLMDEYLYAQTILNEPNENENISISNTTTSTPTQQTSSPINENENITISNTTTSTSPEHSISTPIELSPGRKNTPSTSTQTTEI